MRIGAGFRIAIVVVLLAAAAFAFPALAAAPATNVADRTVVPDGQVYATARVGNTIYLGGYFAHIGPRTGPWVALSAATAKLVAGWPEVTGGAGVVTTSVADGSGGWYIAGSFTHVGGLARRDLAHIRANGTVDPAFDATFDLAPTANVRALAHAGSTLFVGGTFSSIGGKTRNALAALDGSTGKATSWDAGANNASGTPFVDALTVSGSALYVGGIFTGIGGESAGNVAALDVSTGGWLWAGFADSTVQSLAVSGSNVYLLGGFQNVNGQARHNLAALDASNGSIQAWAPFTGFLNSYESFNVLAATPSAVYLGGNFNETIGGKMHRGLVALDPTTGSATDWNPSSGSVRSLAVSGSTVYAGHGSGLYDAPMPGVAAFDVITGGRTAFDPGISDSVSTIGVGNGIVFAGGNFGTANSVERRGAAAIDATTGSVTSWNPDIDGGVFAFASSGNTLYLGGQFTKVGSAPRASLAAFDLATGALSNAWKPQPDPVSPTTWALAASGSTVYAGGEFTTMNGQARMHAAALDSASGALRPWNPNADQTVYDLAASGSTVYADGFFTTIGGQPRTYLAALDATSGLARVGFDAKADGDPSTLALGGGSLFVGGNFSSIGGQPRAHIAALDPNTGNARPWNPGADAGVQALAVAGTTVFAGGSFATIGGKDRPALAALDVPTGAVATWAARPNNAVWTLAASADGGVYAGGQFSTTDLAAQSYFASFSTPPSNKAAPTFSGPPHVGSSLTCAPGTWAGTAPKFTFAWRLDGSQLSGQTSATLTPTLAMAGHQLACAVTASNLVGAAAATSAPVLVPPKPTVVTGRAKKIGLRKATLRGLVTPNGEETTYWFQYGRTKHYGKRTQVRAAGAGAGRPVSVLVKRLKPGKTYHFRLVATSVSGRTYGVDRKFRTKKPKPHRRRRV